MPYTINQQEFLNEQRIRLIQYYNTNKDKLSGFETRDRFIEWYMHELCLFENKCHYCKTSILEIRQLLNAGVIRKMKFNLRDMSCIHWRLPYGVL